MKATNRKMRTSSPGRARNCDKVRAAKSRVKYQSATAPTQKATPKPVVSKPTPAAPPARAQPAAVSSLVISQAQARVNAGGTPGEAWNCKSCGTLNMHYERDCFNTRCKKLYPGV